MHKGKGSPEYHRATTLAEMNPDDMARLGIEDGETVLLRTQAGEARLAARAGTLPTGLIFVPMGVTVNALVAVDTQGTGMPSFKGIRVEVEPAERREVVP